MKLLLGTAALGIAMLSFAGTGNDSQKVSSEKVVSTYQDTLPKKDTTKKHKKEKRDTMYYRY